MMNITKLRKKTDIVKTLSVTNVTLNLLFLKIYGIIKYKMKKCDEMTVYEKIDRALKQHENHKYAERSLESIADYLDWAWKWRKIIEAQKNELLDRWFAMYDLNYKVKHGDWD